MAKGIGRFFKPATVPPIKNETGFKEFVKEAKQATKQKQVVEEVIRKGEGSKRVEQLLSSAKRKAQRAIMPREKGQT